MGSVALPIRTRTLVRTILVAAAIALLVATVATLILLRPASIKNKAERALTERLGLPVTIATLTLSFLPRPQLVGTNIVISVPSQPALPPFIAIDRITADIGPLSAWRGRVNRVRAEGLRISVPPGGPVRAAGGSQLSGDVIVETLEAKDAVLTILRRQPGREPLEFKIHDLRVTDVGFDRVMRFSANLTNPVPRGIVQSEGWMGPWNREQPTDFPLGGDYSFTLANLGTIRGIGGTLTSTGKYEGRLTRIAVSGTTQTPDFSLDIGGTPVPLATEFRAVVDASDGSTVLERVDAMLEGTAIAVEGRIDNLPGPGRRNIELTARVTDGRIEDLLALVLPARPLLVGDVALTSRILLPPGSGPVHSRLVLDGAFDLTRTRFTNAATEARLIELSRRSQGKDESERASRVLTSLAGRFRMASDTITLRGVEFRVPGALVTLDGTYAIPTGDLDLQGNLRIQASVSSAVGGLGSIFLKPLNWIFRRDGAGAIIPITIKGTPRKPEVGVSIRRALGRGR